MPVRLGIVGVGKIARDEHLPAIAASPAFELVAAASRNASVDGVPNFPDLAALLRDGPDVEAVVLCQPPDVRWQAARLAIEQGRHVFLEKPPAASLGEAIDLRAFAAVHGVTLFASWHARYACGVAPARTWLNGRQVRRVAVRWREDVRRWHPGQAWIWEPGGFGVFDPGINALSILTHILPQPLFIRSATMQIPANRAAPIAATVALTDASDTPIDCTFDWRWTGEPEWEIEIEAKGGTLLLTHGGSRLLIDGHERKGSPDAPSEYPALYARFDDLIRDALSDVDVEPLRHVADAFLRARYEVVEPFEE